MTPVNSIITTTSYIHQHYVDKKVMVYNFRSALLYRLNENLIPNHYIEENVKEVYVDSLSLIPVSTTSDSLVLLVMDSDYLMLYPEKATGIHKVWKKENQTVPEWVRWMRMRFEFLNKSPQGTDVYSRR